MCMGARVCVCVCMYIYVYAYDICICVGKYVHVCMQTLVDVNEGPYHPLRFGRRGCCFYKSENTESERDDVVYWKTNGKINNGLQ